MSKYLTLQNLGWLLTAFVTIMLGMGGVSKIIGTEEMVGNFNFMQLSDYLLTVGVLEVLGVALLVYPKTSLYGSVLIGSIMSAAVCMHLSLGFPGTMMPIMLGVAGFAGYKLRETA
jgi:hypothetical protein